MSGHKINHHKIKKIVDLYEVNLRIWTHKIQNRSDIIIIRLVARLLSLFKPVNSR